MPPVASLAAEVHDADHQVCRAAQRWAEWARASSHRSNNTGVCTQIAKQGAGMRGHTAGHREGRGGGKEGESMFPSLLHEPAQSLQSAASDQEPAPTKCEKGLSTVQSGEGSLAVTPRILHWASTTCPNDQGLLLVNTSVAIFWIPPYHSHLDP